MEVYIRENQQYKKSPSLSFIMYSEKWMNRDNIGLSDIFDKYIKTIPKDINELNDNMLSIFSELDSNIDHSKLYIEMINSFLENGKYVIHCVNNIQNSFKYGVLHKLGYIQVVDLNTITFVIQDFLKDIFSNLEDYDYIPKIKTYFNKSLSN